MSTTYLLTGRTVSGVKLNYYSVIVVNSMCVVRMAHVERLLKLGECVMACIHACIVPTHLTVQVFFLNLI